MTTKKAQKRKIQKNFYISGCFLLFGGIFTEQFFKSIWKNVINKNCTIIVSVIYETNY